MVIRLLNVNNFLMEEYYFLVNMQYVLFRNSNEIKITGTGSKGQSSDVSVFWFHCSYSDQGCMLSCNRCTNNVIFHFLISVFWCYGETK